MSRRVARLTRVPRALLLCRWVASWPAPRLSIGPWPFALWDGEGGSGSEGAKGQLGAAISTSPAQMGLLFTRPPALATATISKMPLTRRAPPRLTAAVSPFQNTKLPIEYHATALDRVGSRAEGRIDESHLQPDLVN
jgi:hypothetical protein